MSQDWRKCPFLLFVHQKAHEVLNLRHVHISAVVSAHKDLKGADGICAIGNTKKKKLTG